MKNPEVQVEPWWVAEPDILEREEVSVHALFPDLKWNGVGAGAWEGTLPPWPFDRAEPVGLVHLLGADPFRIRVAYSHAFPAAPPSIIPLSPEPGIELRSFTTYHVMGDGSLCLLRDADQWKTSSLTSDLILKAAGWRIEYALFELGKIEQLSESGIVVDDSLDALIAETIAEASAHD